MKRPDIAYETDRLRDRVLTWIVWRLPRSIVYWATIRVVTADYEGNPSDRTALDALRAWRPEQDTGSRGADLLESAWGVIANASDWDNPDRREWREAAERWRDAYHKTLTVALVIVALLVSAAPAPALAEIPDPPGTIYDGGSCIEPDGSPGLVGGDGTCTTAADYDVIFGYENLSSVEAIGYPGQSIAEVYGIEPDDSPASERPLGEGLVETPRTFRQVVRGIYPI